MSAQEVPRGQATIAVSSTPAAIDRVSRALLISVAILGIGWIVAMAASGEARRSTYFVPAGFTLAALASFLLRGRARAGLATTLVMLAPLPWLAESALSLMDKEPRLRREYAEKHGFEYDGRSVTQIVGDLRAEGRDAWPAAYPKTFVASPPMLDSAGKPLLALGGISNVDTAHGNEEGRFLVYRSDERGFHNPPGLWALPQIDVLAVGDSFTQGSSVPSDRNLIAMVRKRWPATLNLGYGGNGPLVELASLLEYGPKRQPRVVLWVLCEVNDLGEDLAIELQSDLLMSYLKERRAIQGLEDRQAEIDALLRERMEGMRASAVKEESTPRAHPILTLDKLRKAATSLKGAVAAPPEDRWDVFTEVLQVANETTASWGGQLYLVYLPVHRALTDSQGANQSRGTPEERRQRALESGKKAGVPVIDLEPVFEAAGPKAAEFTYPYPSHFTSAGYEALGQALTAQLEATGLLP